MRRARQEGGRNGLGVKDKRKLCLICGRVCAGRKGEACISVGMSVSLNRISDNAKLSE